MYRAPFRTVSLVILLAASLAHNDLADARSRSGSEAAIAASVLLDVNTSATTGNLPNGLKYYIVPLPEAKNVSFVLRVGAGNYFEGEIDSNKLHLIEHMAFGGSRNFSERSIRGWRDQGFLSAATGYRGTSYSFNAPREHMDLQNMLRLARDIAGNLDLTDRTMKRETELVRAEVLSASDFGKIVGEMRHTLYGNAFPEDRTNTTLRKLDSISGPEIRDLYRRAYTSDRMTILIAGPVDPAAAQTDIALLFGDLTTSTPKTARGSGHRPTVDSFLQSKVIRRKFDVKYAVADRTNRLRIISKSERVTLHASSKAKRALEEKILSILVSRRALELNALSVNPKVPAAAMRFEPAAQEPAAGFDIAEVSAEIGSEANLAEALQHNFTILRQAGLHGFTEAEIAWAKTELLSRNRISQTNSQGVMTALTQYLLDADQLPPLDYLSGSFESEISSISRIQLNRFARQKLSLGNDITVVMPANTPESFAKPSHSEIKNVLQTVAESTPAPFVASDAELELMPTATPTLTTVGQVNPGGALNLPGDVHVAIHQTPSGTPTKIGAFRTSVHCFSDRLDLYMSQLKGFGSRYARVRGNGPLLGRLALFHNLSYELGVDDAGSSLSIEGQDTESALQLLHVLMTGDRNIGLISSADSLSREAIGALGTFPPSHFTTSEIIREPGVCMASDPKSFAQFYEEAFTRVGGYRFVIETPLPLDEAWNLVTRYISNLDADFPSNIRQQTWRRLPRLGPYETGKYSPGDMNVVRSVQIIGRSKLDRRDRVALLLISTILSSKVEEVLREGGGKIYSPSGSVSLFENNMGAEVGIKFHIDFRTDSKNLENATALSRSIFSGISAMNYNDPAISIAKSQLSYVEDRKNSFAYDYLYEAKWGMPFWTDADSAYLHSAEIDKDVSRIARRLFDVRNISIVTND